MIDITDELDISIIFQDTDLEDPKEANGEGEPEDTSSDGKNTNGTSPPEVSIVDVLLDGNADIDPEEIEKLIAEEGQAALSIRSMKDVTLKNKGLNKAYYRVSGIIDKNFARDGSFNRISCYANTLQFSMVAVSFEPISYMKSKSPILTGKLGNKGGKYRFGTRGAINIYPEGDGKDLLEGKLDSQHVFLSVSCILFPYSEDLDRYIIKLYDKSLLRANMREIIGYFGPAIIGQEAKYKLFNTSAEFTVYPPEDIKIGQ